MATTDRAPAGRLIESARLVITSPDTGERDTQLHVLLTHTYAGDTWCVEAAELPRRGGRRAHHEYDDQADAYAALDRVYTLCDPIGAWQISRFGNDRLRTPTPGDQPRW